MLRLPASSTVAASSSPPHVAGLEAEIPNASTGVRAVGVANGTDALVIALNALDVGPGDEVITTPYTFYATAEAIARLGATPVFCDIDADDFCIDPDLIEARITDRTKAILPVHIFGHAANMAPIREIAARHGLPVVEDAAQAFGGACDGTPVGALGDLATISFPTKNLPGIGDGGMVVCRDEALAARVRRLRFHGSADKVVFEEVGYNSRLDELQAAVIRIFLKHVDDWNDGRRAAAAAYVAAGLGEIMELPPSGRASITSTTSIWPAMTTAMRSRRGCPQGISSAVYYGIPMHLQPVFPTWATGPATCRSPRRARHGRWRCRCIRTSAPSRSLRSSAAVAEVVGQVPARG